MMVGATPVCQLLICGLLMRRMQHPPSRLAVIFTDLENVKCGTWGVWWLYSTREECGDCTPHLRSVVTVLHTWGVWWLYSTPEECGDCTPHLRSVVTVLHTWGVWWLYSTLSKSACDRLQLNTHAPYACGFAWSDMVHGCMVYTEYTETAAVSQGTSHVSAVNMPFRWPIFKKLAIKS